MAAEHITHKPFSQACENNRRPILEVLRRHFPEQGTVLELGAGTGQHAVYFAGALPRLTWQPTDRQERLGDIEAWRRDAGLENVLPALALEVDQRPWPVTSADAVFSANTAHIMSWDSVCNMLSGVGQVLVPGGVFCLYGPFNRGGAYSSASNARFDQWLRSRDPCSGLRDRDALVDCGHRAGLKLVADEAMPANNRSLIWRRT